jgi:hypothetical protein
LLYVVGFVNIPISLDSADVRTRYCYDALSRQMLTGQTTYEVVKGPRVPYLAPFFPVNEHCANYYALPAAFPRLLADTCLRRRTAPPAPFSRPSVVANLRLFWFARKPHVYR